ncbi:MAG: hypothetical protein VXZ77_04125 [Pseudomonadota bacterium]|nr:hypothetical protein [Pseudomonadota bacterium]
MSRIPENSGGGRAVDQVIAAIGDELRRTTLILNSHHVDLIAIAELLFSRKKVVHRLAGPLTIVRPGIIGALEDEIIRVLNEFAAATVFQSQLSFELNTSILGLSSHKAQVIHNLPCVEELDLNKKRGSRKTYLVVNNHNILKGFHHCRRICKEQGSYIDGILVKNTNSLEAIRSVANGVPVIHCATSQEYYDQIYGVEQVILTTMYEAGSNTLIESACLAKKVFVMPESGLLDFSAEYLQEYTKLFDISDFSYEEGVKAQTGFSSEDAIIALISRRTNALRTLKARNSLAWRTLLHSARNKSGPTLVRRILLATRLFLWKFILILCKFLRR